jgi:hypothetical protein
MKRLFVFALLCSFLMLTGCIEKIVTFGFTKASNPELAADINGVIDDAKGTITVVGEFPNGVGALKASFTKKGSTVLVGTVVQESGVTTNNFVLPVTYTAAFLKLFTKNYVVTVTNTLRRSEIAQTAIAANGDAVIVWLDGGILYLDEKRGGVWSHASSAIKTVSLPGAEVASPKVWMEPDGRTVVVWAQKVEDAWCIFKSDYRGGAWHDPATLDDYINFVGGDAVNPSVSSDKNGYAVIAFLQDNDIWGYCFISGKWQGPWPLNNYQSGIVEGSLNFAMDANGYALTVWSAEIPESESKIGVYMRQLLDGANWSPAVCISSSEADATNPGIAMGDNGDSIVYWIEDGGIYVDQFSGGLWSNVAVGGNRRLNPSDSDASSVKALMKANGDVVISWEQNVDGKSCIFKADRLAGVWTAPADINSFINSPGADAINPSIMALGVYYDWCISYEQDIDIFGYAFMDGAWAGPWLFNDSKRDMVKGTSVFASDANNRGLAVWKQYSSDGDIFLREYFDNAWSPTVCINQ